ncbi:hypothetical protein SUGI_0533810 [Cryptomeria japonica]|nr:hypothetical protein SUGI_0533810 [Cryptomeria japonica]
MTDPSNEKNIAKLSDEENTEQGKDKRRRERSEEGKVETSKRRKKDETPEKPPEKARQLSEEKNKTSKAIVVCGSSIDEPASTVKYMECQNNHGVHLGQNNIVDGCGEFKPSQADEMKCKACNCHRSFHNMVHLDEPRSNVTYMECKRNHGVYLCRNNIVDGCAEFTPSQADGMKCEGCNCHRSFHKMVDLNEPRNTVIYTECQKNQGVYLCRNNIVDGCAEFTPSQADERKCEGCNCHRSFHKIVEYDEPRNTANYTECLKNYGVHLCRNNIVDGCAEFARSQADEMKCEGCNCHRSFHKLVGLDERINTMNYTECQKNHGVYLCRNDIVDGCGEFTRSHADEMKCEACNCHRSFHKMVDYVDIIEGQR